MDSLDDVLARILAPRQTRESEEAKQIFAKLTTITGGPTVTLTTLEASIIAGTLDLPAAVNRLGRMMAEAPASKPMIQDMLKRLIAADDYILQAFNAPPKEAA